MSSTNYRPGVYSRYDISSFYTAGATAAHGAVVAAATGGEEEKLYTFTSYGEAAQVFAEDGQGQSLLGCVKILFESGLSRVYAVPAGEDWAAALALVEELDNVEAVVCGAQDQEDLELLAASVARSAGALRERIGFCGVADPQAALEYAAALNNERVCLCCPGASPREWAGSSPVYCAAAVAGAVLAAGDPARNFSGQVLRTLQSPEKLPEATVQQLLAGGVCVVEQSGESVQLIRALTTRTSTGGVPDRSLTSLNTVLIIDNVVRDLRNSLLLRLRSGRVTTQSLDSVTSQAVVVLAGKVDDGIIEHFQAPKVSMDSADPTVCVVELSFKVAHVVNQILVETHIQV